MQLPLFNKHLPHRYRVERRQEICDRDVVRVLRYSLSGGIPEHIRSVICPRGIPLTEKVTFQIG